MTAPRLYPSAPPLSRLILGGSTFAREIDETASFALMDSAYQRGITMFDTAAMYSAGASEQVVGNWLKSRTPTPDSLIVATKLYPPFTPEAMQAGIKASAARLGVKVIDVLYFHKWDATGTTPESLRALDQFVRSGQVRALGVSNFTAVQLRPLLELQKRLGLAQFKIVQNGNNLALREVDSELVALCASFGVAIVTYSPLGAGFLTGKHRNGVAPGSRFDVAPGHQGVYFHPLAEKRLAHLDAVAKRTGRSMAQLALAWAMHFPGVDSVLVGGRNPSHLDQAFDALALEEAALFTELSAS